MAAVLIDGIIFAVACCVVTLAMSTDGTKVPEGLRDGDTENGTVVTDLLVDLIASGLGCEPGLVVIDGSKALSWNECPPRLSAAIGRSRRRIKNPP